MSPSKLLIIKLPKLARCLSQNTYEAVMLYARLLSFLVTKKIRKDHSPWAFEFCHEGAPFVLSLFEGSPDIAALYEIFVDGEYDWKEADVPQIIVDLGAHTGNTAVYFHLQYPLAKIYAVEASPHTFSELRENVKRYPAIIPIFGAVASEDGTITFFESKSSLGSSLRRRSTADEKVVVPSFTLTSLFERYGLTRVDLLKIDIEGGEENLFVETPPEIFSHNYMIEVHGDLMERQVDYAKTYFRAFKCRELALPQTGRKLLYARKLDET